MDSLQEIAAFVLSWPPIGLKGWIIFCWYWIVFLYLPFKEKSLYKDPTVRSLKEYDALHRQRKELEEKLKNIRK